MERKRSKLGNISDVHSLTDRGYKVIKEGIKSLKLKPGDWLKVSELAEELGISATPVREALSRLEHEGFVEIIPHKGAFVTEISNQSVEEIFELRELLEGAAVKRAAVSFSFDDLRKGEALLEEMRNAFDANDVNSYLKLALDFHYLFINKCGNQTMINVLGSFNEHVERMRKTVVSSSESILTYIEDYKKIYESLKNKKPKEAEQALLSHLERVKKALLKRKRRNKSTSEVVTGAKRIS